MGGILAVSARYSGEPEVWGPGVLWEQQRGRDPHKRRRDADACSSREASYAFYLTTRCLRHHIVTLLKFFWPKCSDGG